ncbi:MAG: DUF4124 domain-containing protein [Betaproteobacteria bacterium]|nr:DUF4124 domain-containing protein [Betaproteobacteria bacterium]
MTMNRALSAALILASSMAASAALAQAYQWKDSSGRTVISDTPPPASVKGTKSIGTSPPPAVGTGGAATDAPKTTAEKDMEFRKRQQDAREKSEKEAKEAAAAQQKRENCDRARSQLGALESGRRMVVPDGKGGEVFLEDDARNAEMERARKIIADSCN